MILINHDWDNEDYQKTLESAFKAYIEAAHQHCSPMQYKEARQAFLSGIYWLCDRDSYDPYEIQSVLRRIIPKEREADEEE